jgi:CBS domain-containing membrane protein
MAGDTLIAWLKRFVPVPMAMSHGERLRAALGIVIGLGLTGVVCSPWTGNVLTAPLLIAPMGASAILMFAVPASPLAQPWSVVGGHLVAALVGVTAAQWLHPPLVAAAIAVMVAMLAMSALRCLHPPSGAIAMIAVLGGPKILATGYGFLLVPVLLNSLILTAAALVYNNLTGRSYPHQAHPQPSKPVLALSHEDLDAALSAYGETLDISRADLEGLFQDLALRASKHK